MLRNICKNSLALIIITAVLINAAGCNAFKNQSKGENKVAANELINEKPTTYCNPLNLNYYMIEHGMFGAGNWKGQKEYAFREAADPSVCVFGNKYFLFTSIADGYWVSDDLVTWEYLEIENKADGQMGSPAFFAPTAVTIGDTMYYTRGGTGIWKTKTPLDPNSWVLMPGTEHGLDDIQFFYDPDIDKLYVTHGCSGKYEVYIQEFDKNTMRPIGEQITVRTTDYQNRGFDRSHIGWWAEDSDLENEGSNYTEGSQMFKYQGKYYLIYAGQNLNNTYCDSVLVSDSPTGPFRYPNYNPVSMKMRGFANGAGHGQKFEDLNGNWWNVVTQDIYTYDSAERRVSMFPVGFTEDGQMMCDTYLGDMPLRVSTRNEDNGTKQRSAGFFLLSKDKPVTVSSTLKGYSTDAGVDNNIRTFWSAETGNEGEFYQVDLLNVCDVNAIQVNFCEVDAQRPVNRSQKYLRYKILYSADNRRWDTLADKSDAKTDLPHDYLELKKAVKARYIKVICVSMPYGAKFSIRDLRVFGKGTGELPEKAVFNVTRDYNDTRNMNVSWERADRAEGYIIRFGVAPDRLFQVYECYDRDATSAQIRYLITNTEYYVTVDTINENGITRGDVVLKTGDPKCIYEAEDGVLSNGSVVALNLDKSNNVEAASGGKVVDMTTPGATCYFKFNVEADGKYRIGIHYSSYGHSRCRVSVNGADPVAVEAPSTNGYTAFNKVLIFEQDLKKGENSLEVITETGYLMLDCISVNQMQMPQKVEDNAERLSRSIDSLPEREKITKFYEKTLSSIKDRYDRLSDSEKALVKNYKKIEELQIAIKGIKLKERGERIKFVEKEIAALPKAEKIKDEDKALVNTVAKDFFDLLTEEQKLVKNSCKLKDILKKFREQSGNVSKTISVTDKFENEYSPHPSLIASEQFGIGWDGSSGARRNYHTKDAYVVYEAQQLGFDYFTGCRITMQLSGSFDRVDIFTSVNGKEWVKYNWENMKYADDDPEGYEARNSTVKFPENTRYIKFSIPEIDPKLWPPYAIMIKSVVLHGAPIY